MTGEQLPALTVGAVLGDSDADSMAWSRAIGQLSQEVILLRDGILSPVRVGVAFHVDGRTVPNEFTGVRIGRFSKRSMHLVVQVALTKSDAKDKREVLLSLLSDALDEAEQYVQHRDLADGLRGLRQLESRLRGE